MKEKKGGDSLGESSNRKLQIDYHFKILKINIYDITKGVNYITLASNNVNLKACILASL